MEIVIILLDCGEIFEKITSQIFLSTSQYFCGKFFHFLRFFFKSFSDTFFIYEIFSHNFLWCFANFFISCDHFSWKSRNFCHLLNNFCILFQQFFNLHFILTQIFIGIQYNFFAYIKQLSWFFKQFFFCIFHEFWCNFCELWHFFLHYKRFFTFLTLFQEYFVDFCLKINLFFFLHKNSILLSHTLNNFFLYFRRFFA